MIPSDATHVIRAYSKRGDLLIETWHRGEASKDVEVSVFRERMKKGEVGFIEVVARNHPYNQEVLYK